MGIFYAVWHVFRSLLCQNIENMSLMLHRCITNCCDATWWSQRKRWEPWTSILTLLAMSSKWSVADIQPLDVAFLPAACDRWGLAWQILDIPYWKNREEIFMIGLPILFKNWEFHICHICTRWCLWPGVHQRCWHPYILRWKPRLVWALLRWHFCSAQTV